MECLTSTRISILVNGSPTKEFGLYRGLWQGDPLSPFLFLIVAKGLSVMMKQAAETDIFSGYNVGGTRLEITHLQLADDTILVGEAT